MTECIGVKNRRIVKVHVFNRSGDLKMVVPMWRAGFYVKKQQPFLHHFNHFNSIIFFSQKKLLRGTFNSIENVLVAY